MPDQKLIMETRIRELENELEGYRYAAQLLSEELFSILVPYSERNSLATAIAVEKAARNHPALGRAGSREVH